MATATTIPTAPQNSSYKGVLRGRRKDSTPTLFPDVPVQRDSGPDALPPPGSRPERAGIARLLLPTYRRHAGHGVLPFASTLDLESLRFRPRAVFLDGKPLSGL